MSAASIYLVATPLGHLCGPCRSSCGVFNAEIRHGFFITEVIGDFPKKEARQFLEYTLGNAGKSSHLTDDDWHRVYEVRHGNRRRAVTAIARFHTASDQP